MLLYDVTSTYFEGLAEANPQAQRGYSRDHRPDCKQVCIALVVTFDGFPLGYEVFAGNTHDLRTLQTIVAAMEDRHGALGRVWIADRGMASAEAIAELEARRLLYILGVRERTDKLVRELVLDDPAPFVPLALSKRGKEIDYEAKTVMLAGRRYIVCRNHQEAEKDAADRASIVAALERQLAKGDKALVGNAGFRRYLKTIGGERFAIDSDKIEEERKFDWRACGHGRPRRPRAIAYGTGELGGTGADAARLPR